MAKLYELLVRFHPNGEIGAHAVYYKEDGVTPDNMAYPIHTDDFPAPERETIKQLMGTMIDDVIADNVKIRAERDHYREALEMEASTQPETQIEGFNLFKPSTWIK